MEYTVCIISHEQVYRWWMRHVAASNFSLHSLTTLVPTFFCTCFAHIGSQSSFTPPPKLCSIDFTCTHWIQNPSKACVGVETKICHKLCFITNDTQASAIIQILIYIQIYKIVKSDHYLHHIHPSALNDSANTSLIFMKFDVWIFFEYW
jgi:hypothetical protein